MKRSSCEIYMLLLKCIRVVTLAMYGCGAIIFTVHANIVPDDNALLQKLEEEFHASQLKENTDGKLDEEFLRANIGALSAIKINVTALINKTSSQIAQLSTDLKVLGEATGTEPAEVTAKRAALIKQKNLQESFLAKQKLLLLKSEEKLQLRNQQLTNTLAERLFSKGPSFLTLSHQIFIERDVQVPSMLAHVSNQMGIEDFTAVDYLMLAAAVFVVFAISFWLRRGVKKRCAAKQRSASFTSRFAETFIFTFARFLPYILVTTAVAVFLLINNSAKPTTPILNIVFWGLPLCYIALFLVQLFLAPKKPARLIIDVPLEYTKPIARRLRVLIAVIFLGYIYLFSLYTQSADERVLFFARDILLILLAVNLIWVLAVMGRLPQLVNIRWLRLSVILLLGAVTVIELVGYRNLAYSGFRVMFTLLVTFGMVILLNKLFTEFYDGIDSGSKPWHKPIRSALGLQRGQHVPGLSVIRFLTVAVLWVLFILILLDAVRLSDTVIRWVQTVMVKGFNFGSLEINPARILFAILILTFLSLLSSWLKVQINSFLSKSRMERGAREALVTIAGYTGIALAIIIALGIAGVTFTNIAIIAGALSVGIGFGLQNIVNNFVSGLILLFERPVKKGDWVVVGNTEGYVKKISIRSTQIQTFDRADVIVPNSDLISNQVTNWMLYDSAGRVRIPVGVAYGSDVEKVRDILLGLAAKDTRVIHNNDDYPVRVYFLNFGDSSLNFELRCHIENIDNRLTVISDMNFAINKAFRENNIEIPFPQRDVHIKSKVENTF